jgi:hypothetical protein
MIFTGLTAAKAVTSAGGFLKRIVKSPWFWAMLLVVAVGGGTYHYLKNDKKEAVATAVKGADQAATAKTLETEAKVFDRQQAIEHKYTILHEQTVKDYSNARATLSAAPIDERQAPAPRIIVDTINNLDRLRAGRDQTTVPDTQVPVG